MQDELLYVIGLGGREDWEAGRGSVYWIEAPNGEHALPVFTTPEGAHKYWEANSGVRERLELADSTPTTHQGPLLQNRITLLPLDGKGLALAAARVDADYLIRDIQAGAEQEILRLDEG
ncbi:MAG: hypothetical protein H0U04_08630 [Rubrobacter sp.]|nr:hypothetical protein [Rubrobacter sp.]